MAVLFKSTWETKEPEEQDATMSAVAEIKNSGIFMVFKVEDKRIYYLIYSEFPKKTR